MKVKKFNNLWTMGLILSGAMLLTVYVLKFFFPEFVIEISHTDSIVKIGKYIDTHKWLSYIINTILSFGIYYLICCACCSKKSLSWKECLIILATILFGYFVKEFMPNQYQVVNLGSTLLLPLLFKGKFFITVVVWLITNFLQTITLEIRNIIALIYSFNFATVIILMIDYYIMLVLLYFLFNYKKGD